MGPYNVGYRVFETSYQPLVHDGTCTIPVHVWYPTDDIEGDDVVYELAWPDPEAFGGAAIAQSPSRYTAGSRSHPITSETYW